MSRELKVNLTTGDGRSIEEALGDPLARFHPTGVTSRFTPNPEIVDELRSMIEVAVQTMLEDEADDQAE